MDNFINHLSLCSGYGGIDIGLQSVLPTCRTVAYVEIEAFACANLVAKMEEGRLDPAPIWTDLRTFDARPLFGHVGVLSGGFPCQPFSQSGKRKADKDPRHLFPEFERIIDECRPGSVFLENVEGIITSKLGGRSGTSVLKHVLERLETRGFRTAWGLFSASEVGATHRRNRVFILGLANTNDSGGGEDSQQGESRPTWLEQPPDPPRCLQPKALEQVTRWPAGPTENQHDWEKPRTVERAVGRAANGDTSRLDRLRLLGNGVVPQQSARAFVTLMNELTLFEGIER